MSGAGVLRGGVEELAAAEPDAVGDRPRTSFILQATKDGASLTTPAGYATLGGVVFLVPALRLKAAR
ncbi:hypothetical protein [Amycolatopsis sp. MEPSY49]|uniref:hypothetical protein n=1 Tax=Amycolatopsis sp. MEPSY49 TaxID=3151600 RepID=UPI003EF0EB9E